MNISLVLDGCNLSCAFTRLLATKLTLICWLLGVLLTIAIVRFYFLSALDSSACVAEPPNPPNQIQMYSNFSVSNTSFNAITEEQANFPAGSTDKQCVVTRLKNVKLRKINK